MVPRFEIGSAVLAVPMLLAPMFPAAAAMLAALGAHGLELRSLLGGQDRCKALVLLVAERLHLRPVRFHGVADGRDARLVARFLRRSQLAHGVAEAFVDRFGLGAEALAKSRELLLLRVGQIELGREPLHVLRSAALSFEPSVTGTGEGEGGSEGQDRCCCQKT